MPFLQRGFLAGLLALIAIPCAVAAEGEPPPDVPVAQWLQGPERRDFEWKVQLFGPWLSFQQRYVVGIRASMPVRKLLGAGVSLADLHFVVRVRDNSGQWLPGQHYSLFVPPPDIAKARGMQFFTHFYARPGNYSVAVLAYDSRNRRGNVWKSDFQVPVLKPDPLPEAGRNLPAVEFRPEMGSEPWAPEHARLYLPVANVRPVQLDVVVNLSLSGAMNTRYAEAPDWLYRTNAAVLLQIGRVLSQLDLKKGCVRFSAVDIVRQRVFADRTPGPDVDWGQLLRSVDLLQRNKIDVHVLGRQKLTPALFAKFLEQVSSGPSACGQAGEAPAHALLVVSDAFLFPGKIEMTAVRPEVIPGTQCYYLQVNSISGGNWDQIGRVLRPLHPTRWEFSNATRFREVVAHLIAEIQSLSPEGKR